MKLIVKTACQCINFIHDNSASFQQHRICQGQAREFCGRSELDSRAGTTVVGANCCIFQYSGKEGYVSPYCEDYEAIKGVPIVGSTIVFSNTRTTSDKQIRLPIYQSQLATSLRSNKSLFSKIISIIGGESRRGEIYK